jgi:FkbM family methyltransferase
MTYKYFLKICKKLVKLLICLSNSQYRAGLFQGIGAAIEHDSYFKNSNFRTVVDAGANCGQFSLVMRRNFPDAKIFAFEPLSGPAEKFKALFVRDPETKLFNAALARKSGSMTINVSASDDSSSLLPISDLQERTFPGTAQATTQEIMAGPLSDFVNESEIQRPALLKLDVQGFELEVLKACGCLIDIFDEIYCECSFFELYTGQALAPEIIGFMSEMGFTLKGFNNVNYDDFGKTVQADFIFVRNLK